MLEFLRCNIMALAETMVACRGSGALRCRLCSQDKTALFPASSNTIHCPGKPMYLSTIAKANQSTSIMEEANKYILR